MYDRTVCQFLGNIQLIFVHETVVPSADINETDVQDYHQHRDIDLGDYNSLEEDDALVGDISPEGRTKKKKMMIRAICINMPSEPPSIGMNMSKRAKSSSTNSKAP